MDGVVVSAANNLRHEFGEPGEHEVRLVVRGPGGDHSATRTIRVTAIPAPVASLVVGASVARVGDLIRLTDTSLHTQRVVWSINGVEIERDYAAGDSANANAKHVEHVFQQAEPVSITLTAYGPGGEDRTTTSLEVQPRWLAPEARMQLDRDHGVGSLRVVVRNYSIGTVYRSVYTVGDQRIEVDGPADATFELRPGEYELTLTVFGPEEFSPSATKKRISVAPPPTWVEQNAALLAAMGLVLTGLAGFAAYRIAGRISALQRCKLAGVLSYRPANDPLQPFAEQQFNGASSVEEFELPDGRRAVLKGLHDSAADTVRYQLDLHDGDQLLASEILDVDRLVRLADYDVQFVP